MSKLVFIFLLGNDIEFGHTEAIGLLQSTKFSEKQMGYMFVSVLMADGHELMKMVIEAVSMDLKSTKELDVCLALNCIANVGGNEMSIAIAPLVKKLLVSRESPVFVKKKAALAMLKLARQEPGPACLSDPSFSSDLLSILGHSDLGLCTSVASLVICVCYQNPEHYKGAVRVAVDVLHRLLNGDVTSDYNYYQIPAPWLCVKMLRILQIFPAPEAGPDSGPVWTRLTEVLEKIVTRARPLAAELSQSRPQRPKAQHTNVINGVFFESVHLLVHYNGNNPLELTCATLLGEMLEEKASNLRFLALDGLCQLARADFCRAAVKKYMINVLKALKSDTDPTVQRRAVDVLYQVCDQQSVQSVVTDLLIFLKRSDYSIREDVVLKIAILAEKFAPDFSWYVNIMLTLIKMAGDHVSDEVWHRVVQIIVNKPDCQAHAVHMCFEAILDASCHEAMVKVAAYVLGEFGHLIANDPACVPEKQFEILQQLYPMVTSDTRGLIISTYVKFANIFPELKAEVLRVLGGDVLARNSNSEIQQRANEYRAMLMLTNEAVVEKVLDEMPPFKDKESAIESKLEKSRDGVDQKNASSPTRPPAAGVTPALVASPAAVSSAVITNEEFFKHFSVTDNGKLYENPVLQIGLQAEYRQAHARLNVFYGNRGGESFTGCSAVVDGSGCPELSLTAQSVSETFAPGAQIKQEIAVVCQKVFTGQAYLDVSLVYQGRPIKMHLKLPVSVNKFCAPLPSPLDASAFFSKWQQLGTDGREVTRVVECSATDAATVTSKLAGFKLPCLPGIDPNTVNHVGTAILHTTAGQIGCLARFEPLPETKTIRLTIRSSDPAASLVLAELAGLLLA